MAMSVEERALRDAVLARSKGLCEVCGGRGGELSHRQSRAVGAHRYCPCNGLWACRTCHMDMHAHSEHARHMGWHVSRYYTESPADLPVLLARGWVRLTCEGLVIPLTPL